MSSIKTYNSQLVLQRTFLLPRRNAYMTNRYSLKPLLFRNHYNKASYEDPVSATDSTSIPITDLSSERQFTNYLNDPVKLIVVPVTEEKLFIYFKHEDSFLNKDSLLIKYEDKINQKVKGIWEKMATSPKSYNKKIVGLVNKFLYQINWTEYSLTSIPSEGYILKKIKQESNIKEKFPSKSKITLKEYLDYLKTTRLNNPTSDTEPKIIEPIKIYYPGVQISKERVLKEMKTLSEYGLEYHKKQMIYNALALPLTLPLVLVPLLPNVPGFYLAYRFYCNLKAYLGAKHLKSIYENERGNKLELENLEKYSNLFEITSYSKLTESQATDIVELLKLPELKGHLVKAIHQEQQKQK